MLYIENQECFNALISTPLKPITSTKSTRNPAEEYFLVPKTFHQL